MDTHYIDRAGGRSLSRLPDFEDIVSRPPALRDGRVVDYVFVNYVSGVAPKMLSKKLLWRTQSLKL